MNAPIDLRDPVPLISVCMICKRQVVANHKATGSPLAPATNHSHGICSDCAPDYLKSLQLTDAQQSQILKHITD